MDGSINLRRLAALRRSRITQTAPADYFRWGVSADQALRSYKWSYIRLAALNFRWQNLWSYWAIGVVLTPLDRTIFSLFDIFEQCQCITIARCAGGDPSHNDGYSDQVYPARAPLWIAS